MIGEIAMLIVAGVLVGVASTMTMDVLGSLSRKVGLAAGANGQWSVDGISAWLVGNSFTQISPLPPNKPVRGARH